MSGGYPDPQPSPAPVLSEAQRRRLEADYERFREALPVEPRSYCLEAYGVDIAGEYGGASILNPFGKASGQLSLNVRQVARDVEAGLGFVVLKTVIAEDDAGNQQMHEWAVRETRMRIDRIPGADAAPGWTVTWKGRGWHDTFEAYCRFFSDALTAASGSATLVAASVKYHLPPAGGGDFAVGEYRHTTRQLLEVWQAHRQGPMLLEKDFSPTLAGDDRSREREQILHWLRSVPELIYASAPEGKLSLGVKLMNAQAEPEFQLAMLRTLVEETSRPPDFIIYANRLFDATKEFEGKVGVAYGGPDLSARNLAALQVAMRAVAAGDLSRPLPSISGTGDILSGRMAVRYGLAGATSCQMHTVFQLPDTEFGATMRNKSAAVLHHLLFHPHNGCLPWLLDLSSKLGRPVNWLDLPKVGRQLIASEEA